MEKSIFKVHCLLLLFFFAGASTLKAQRDFIVTFEGDTVKGEIITPTIGGPRFLATGSTKKEKIRIKEVKEYFINYSGKNVLAKIIPGRTDYTFLERIERGKIELYEIDQMMYTASPYGGTTSRQLYWYASKDQGPIITLKHNSWLTFSKERRKNEFYEMIKDNESVASRFLEEEKFSFNEIRKLVSLYNADARRKVK